MSLNSDDSFEMPYIRIEEQTGSGSFKKSKVPGSDHAYSSC
ncbi:hypothetical protein Pint_11659 [Pistacia integerrima]|uniref:Uncharacterized protein n=1 Tax=Pistacia integerrima TaxID=434235 RepID=A0ACC0XL30_9ROSI|nr:hypothetical protein Pint_11659 [Pistacia integerrima]